MPHATILYVEDNEMVLHMVKETLELEGWQVETCGDGLAALRRIESGERYDLLLLDNELPGVGGLELAKRARSLAHRRQTPIIMISASENRRAARRAGVNEFLKKPDDMPSIVATITRLLAATRSA